MSQKEPTLTPTERRLSRTFKNTDSIIRDPLQTLFRHPGFAPTSPNDDTTNKPSGSGVDRGRSPTSPDIFPQASSSSPRTSLQVQSSPLAIGVVELPGAHDVGANQSFQPPPSTKTPSVASMSQRQDSSSMQSTHSRPASTAAAATALPVKTTQMPVLPVDLASSVDSISGLRQSAPELTTPTLPANAPPALVAHATRLPRKSQPHPQQQQVQQQSQSGRPRSGTFHALNPAPASASSTTARSSSLIPRRKRPGMTEALEALASGTTSPRLTAASPVVSPRAATLMAAAAANATVVVVVNENGKDKEAHEREKREKKARKKEKKEAKRQRKEQRKSMRAKGPAEAAAKEEVGAARIETEQGETKRRKEKKEKKSTKEKKTKERKEKEKKTKEKKTKKEEKRSKKKERHEADVKQRVDVPAVAVAESSVRASSSRNGAAPAVNSSGKVQDGVLSKEISKTSLHKPSQPPTSTDTPVSATRVVTLASSKEMRDSSRQLRPALRGSATHLQRPISPKSSLRASPREEVRDSSRQLRPALRGSSAHLQRPISPKSSLRASPREEMRDSSRQLRPSLRGSAHQLQRPVSPKSSVRKSPREEMRDSSRQLRPSLRGSSTQLQRPLSPKDSLRKSPRVETHNSPPVSPARVVALNSSKQEPRPPSSPSPRAAANGTAISPKSSLRKSPEEPPIAASPSSPLPASPEPFSSPTRRSEGGIRMRRTPSDLSARRRHRRRVQEANRLASRAARHGGSLPPEQQQARDSVLRSSSTPSASSAGSKATASGAPPVRAASSPVPANTRTLAPPPKKDASKKTEKDKKQKKLKRLSIAAPWEGLRKELEAEGLAPKRANSRPKATAVVVLRPEKPQHQQQQQQQQPTRGRQRASAPGETNRHSVHTLIDIAKLKITT